MSDEEAYREQVAYLLERSAFYRDKLAGLEPGGLEDIAELPLTEKRELRAAVTPQNPIGAHLCAAREEIAREKLAVAGPDAIVVLGEPEWARLVPGRDVRLGGARETAEAFLGRPIERVVDVSLPGRLEWRGPDEVWDGAHNPAGLDWQAARLPERDWVVDASILSDKDVGAMLERLARLKEQGALTASEFDAQKAKLLGSEAT